MTKIANIAVQFDYHFGTERVAQIIVHQNKFTAQLVGGAFNPDSGTPELTAFTPPELIELGRLVTAVQEFGLKRIQDQLEAQSASPQ